MTIKMGNGRIIKYAARLLLAVIIGLFMLGSSPTPVQAVDPPSIILTLGGTGSNSWSIDGILPCQSGTETLTLQNAGNLDGFVIIWVSDIVSLEGENPEPETDTEGELDDYLLFDLSANPTGALDTNLALLPTTIDNFPQDPYDPNYIWIVPLNPGNTVTLYWHWELPCATGNDAQGDTLSFDITYFLVDDFPPPPPPSPPPPLFTGGPGAEEDCFMEIDMLGEITTIEMDCCLNRTLEEELAYDPDDLHFMEILYNMEILCGECTECYCFPHVVVMSLSEYGPPPPEDMAIAGPVYDFTGYEDSDRNDPCYSATFFDPSLIIQLSYDPDDLPAGASSPVIAFFDDVQGLWITLPPASGIPAEIGRITAETNYLASPFAILVNVPPPSQPPALANFVVSGLNITSSVREIWQPVTFVTKTGESVTITANVTNGGGQAGTFTVELQINGETIATKEVTPGAGQSELVSFTLTDLESGRYGVMLSGLSGDFKVFLSINWWLIISIIAALLLLGWLNWYLWYRKKWPRVWNRRKWPRINWSRIWSDTKGARLWKGSYWARIWSRIRSFTKGLRPKPAS